jgi:hypothetical protein
MDFLQRGWTSAALWALGSSQPLVDGPFALGKCGGINPPTRSIIKNTSEIGYTVCTGFEIFSQKGWKRKIKVAQLQ